jgi:pyruvate dehydrogenase E2 component (dihydrolipoamide acetyltransferase)
MNLAIIGRSSLESPCKNHIPLTSIQKLIGARMLKSKIAKPCFYLEVKADVTEMMELRHSLRKTLGVKVTTNAFYIRALALAARQCPLVTARIDTDSITVAQAINVGFAVDAPQGLVVPVVKCADKKSLAEIAQLEKLLTEKARANRLTLEEMESETLALSNLGVYGVDSFFGIVPPPASTILAVGNVIPAIVCQSGDFITRKMISLSVAADHRIINGLYAARFLNCITELLANPQRLVYTESLSDAIISTEKLHSCQSGRQPESRWR